MQKMFPALVQGYDQNTVDLNAYMIRHPSATIFIKIDNSHYRNMGIYNGDLLVIDRAKKLNPNSLVVYESEGRFVLGRFFNIKGETIITGVVTHVIHTVKDI